MPVRSERIGAGTARTRVVDYIAEYLARRGVRHVFGVDGANIEDLYDAAHSRPELTAVVAKHEFSAAAMADAYRRAGADLGVVVATSGGGALNTVAGLGESFASRVPVLALIGQPPRTLDGRGSFQDTSGVNGALDGEALFSAVSVFCRRITAAADIVTALPEAISAAMNVGGPAVLLLPKDIQQAVVEAPGGGIVESPDRAGVDLAEVVRLLRSTRGPVTILAGDQVVRDGAQAELETLRATLNAAIAVVPDAKDAAVAPDTTMLAVAGVMGHPAVAAALSASALCLLVGTRLPLMARAGLDAPLASMPIASIGSATPYLPAVHVHSKDLRAALTQLSEAVAGADVSSQAPQLGAAELVPPTHDGPGVRYRDAMLALDAVLPAGTDIVVDAGNIGAAAIHWLPARHDGRFLVALGMGGMGYSFGAGIGMAFARRRHTVVIAGDGSFFMHGMEIHTALQHRLPVTFILFDNHAHAMCVTREQLFYGDRYSYNRFGPSRLGAGLAAMFPALPSVDVTDIGEFGVAVKAALDADGPAVVSVECSADEIPPFIAFLDQRES